MLFSVCKLTPLLIALPFGSAVFNDMVIRKKGSNQCVIPKWNGGVVGEHTGSEIILTKCDETDPNQIFQYDTSSDKLIKHKQSGFCIDGNEANTGHPYLWTCGPGPNHRWNLNSQGHLTSDNAPSKCLGWDTSNHNRGKLLAAGSCDTIQFFHLTEAPSSSPSSVPSISPSSAPSSIPSTSPSSAPSVSPSPAPTPKPTQQIFGPKTGSSSGDPHFKTFSGDKYDFHGQCDLVLLNSPNFGNGMGLRIHIRTKIETWWSFIESAVVQIGSQMLELKGGPEGEGPQYWVNSLPGQEDAVNDPNLKSLVEELEAQLAGFKVHYKRVSSKQHKFRIDLNHAGDAISLETYKDWIAVNVKASKASNFKGSLGLMGTYPAGTMMARDGVTVVEHPDAFGLEWQVHSSEPMLFHAVSDVQLPHQKCIMPSLDASASRRERRRLGEALLTEELAAEACEHAMPDERDACIFDVLATNDKDAAGAY